MNREQARTILIGLSDDDYDAKVAVVDVVLDLVTAEQGQQRWTVDEPFTPKPWTPEEAARVGPVSNSASVAAELDGLRAQRDELLAAARVFLTGSLNDTTQVRHLREVVERIDNKTTREDT